jgi:hypothetical protein
LLCLMQEGINGEFEEKKADLQPKVVEIYESVTAPVKVRNWSVVPLSLLKIFRCISYGDLPVDMHGPAPVSCVWIDDGTFRRHRF